MYKILTLLILLISTTIAYGQGLSVSNGPIQHTSLDQEALDAILFLEKIPAYDREFVRFFSTYAVPPELRQKCVLTTSFVCHSLAGVSNDSNITGYYPLAKVVKGMFVPQRLVPGSKTLWWVDLREYNWTPAAWEKMASVDGYFVEPCIDYEINSQLRLLAGNAIIRADWFIWHGTNIMAQVDQNEKVKIYEELLYAQNDIPKTGNAFRKIWGLDVERARKLGNEFGALSLRSRQVARHNRVLMGYRTELGWLYETYDVKSENGRRNYLESLPENRGFSPDFRDAGEIFASNQLHMQVYALIDSNDNIVDFADPSVARHVGDILGDVRVKTAYSCMDCHSAGPLPAENIVRDYGAFLNLQMPNKKDAQRFQQTYLSGRFEESVTDNQELFARALLKVNGLTPLQNHKNFLELVKWYNEDIDLNQAAFECGVTVEQFIGFANKADVYPVPAMSGRLMLMLNPKNPIKITRESWENRGADGIPGYFQQSMVMIKGLTKIETTEFQKETIIEELPVEEVKAEEIKEPEVSDDDKIKKGDKVKIIAGTKIIEAGSTNILTVLDKSTEFEVKNTREVDGTQWIFIEYEGKTAGVQVFKTRK